MFVRMFVLLIKEREEIWSLIKWSKVRNELFGKYKDKFFIPTKMNQKKYFFFNNYRGEVFLFYIQLLLEINASTSSITQISSIFLRLVSMLIRPFFKPYLSHEVSFWKGRNKNAIMRYERIFSINSGIVSSIPKDSYKLQFLSDWF